ncbi:MAG TPA: hypothetical protein DFS52_28305 [Myxococcales bacterium]|jgi:Uma2 family endonuclease|nr:hypothetical protein [Myxococcales bacterium]
MINPDLIAPETVRPFSRQEYDRMVEQGLLGDERVELLAGALIRMAPQGPEHAEVITKLQELLVEATHGSARVRTQMPFAASDDSQPEPDLALVPPGDYSKAHPARALLIVEVADATRRKDRELKSRIYAEAGVPEYWVVDLVKRRIEVRRRPLEGDYTELKSVTAGVLRPDAFPDVEVPVSQVLG